MIKEKLIDKLLHEDQMDLIRLYCDIDHMIYSLPISKDTMALRTLVQSFMRKIGVL